MEENKNQSEDCELQKSTASPTHHQTDSCMSLGDMNKEVGCRLDDCTTDDALLCPHNQANHEGKANQTHSPGKNRKFLDTSDVPVLMDTSDFPGLRMVSCSNISRAKELKQLGGDGGARPTDPSLADGYTCRLKETRLTKEQSGRGSIESSMADDVNSSNDTFKSSCFPPWDHVKKKFKRKRQGHKEANTNLGKEHEKK